MHTAVLALTLSLLGVSPVFAHGDALAKAPVASDVQFLDQETGLDAKPTLAHNEWAFVGCVVSSHDCSHHAHEQGYSNHRVEQDEDTCPSHPHLACYGQ